MSPRGLFCVSGVGKHEADARTRLGVRDLDGVPAEIRTMRRTLASLGLTEHLPFDTEERSHVALELGLGSGVPEGVETLVIYCTGHGIFSAGRFHLLLPDGNRFQPARLIEPLEEWEGLREVVLIVDACSAEPGVDAALVEARRANTQTSTLGFWGIGASRRLETARQESFATAFAAAVGRAARQSWTISHIDPGAVAHAVDTALGPEQNVWLADGHPARPCGALPNPRHQSPARPTGLPLPADWAAAARGVSAPDLPGFFFAGRTAVLRDLREHLMNEDDDAPVVVVTGGTGSGRSALLGHLVLTTHEAGRRAMPADIRLAWPALPVTVAAGRGSPSQVTAMLTRALTGTDGPADLATLAQALRAVRGPVGLVLDDLTELENTNEAVAGGQAPTAAEATTGGQATNRTETTTADRATTGAEATGPGQWARFFETVRSVPGVRLVVGLPAGSGSPVMAPAARVHDLDDLDDGEDDAAEGVREYVRAQVALAVPQAREQRVRQAVDTLAARVGAEFAVAVALTAVPRFTAGDTSVDGYLARATKAVDVAAHRVCRTRVAAELGGAKAAAVVSALSALCGDDEAIALPAAEWAAAASVPGGPLVTAGDVAVAARLMRSLAVSRPAADGTPRWRARFGHPDAGGYPTPDEFLRRLPQVARWEAVDWRAADPAVLLLVARAAALGLIPGRLLDDPAFLLDAPPTVVSKALRELRGDPGERARRSRMWRLVPRDAPDDERALLLRIGAQRFDVTPLVTAFRASRPGPDDRAAAQPGRRSAHAVDWVQPDRSRTTRVTQMATTSAGPHAAIVTVQDDDSLAFWNPADGTGLRGPVSLPGTPRDVTAAVVRGRALALVSTWRHGIWLVPCDEDAAPTPLPELVPPPVAGGGTTYPAASGEARPVPLLPALHPSGQVVVAAGSTVWAGELGTGLRKLATMDTELLAVRTAGPVAAPVVWLVPASGRVRRLRLGAGSSPAVRPFPVPHRPLAVAVSEAGDQALIVDVTGGVHLRGTRAEGAIGRGTRSSEIRAAALDAATVVLGGSTGRSGWLEIHDGTSFAAPTRLPLDDPAVALALHGPDRLLIARPCGLLSLRLPDHPVQPIPYETADHHG